MLDQDRLLKQFEDMLDKRDELNEVEKQGRLLIKEIESHLSKVDYNIEVSVMNKYDLAIDRNVWDKQLVKELEEVKALILNLQ